jgi:UDP-N-acetylmuramoyl-tripeptide--D-alanyl-D-alanine ligase
MAELRLDWIAKKTGGVLRRGEAALTFDGFAIDSRLVRPGDLFFAIVAARDGHDFVRAAAEHGARGAVVSKPVDGLPAGFALISVDDTVLALQRLACQVLAARPIQVVGITGSVGKTTTKEFAAALLGPRFVVLKSEGNFNNHLGLALSLLRLEDRHTAAVLEMGMSGRGEIRDLTAIAPPDIAVITNVNPVHLAYLQNLEAVAAAKWEIVEGLKPGGTAVLNGDDPHLRRAASSYAGPKILFGVGPDADVAAEKVVRCGFGGFEFDLRIDDHRAPCRLAFLTDAYLYNVLAAAAVAHALGIPLQTVAEAIAFLRPAPQRGQWLQLGREVVLIDDSYNSNPQALDTALRGLAGLPAARKVAVLGDMLELGEDEIRYHEEAGRRVAEEGWDILIAIGPLSRRTAAAAVAAGMPGPAVVTFDTSADAAGAIAAWLRNGDLVLVKGSRGMRTEAVADKIKALTKES